MEFKSKDLKKDLIMKRMVDKPMTTEAASKEIGISRGTLHRIENGRTPDIDTFIKICIWLGKTPNDYFSIMRPRQEGFKL